MSEFPSFLQRTIYLQPLGAAVEFVLAELPSSVVSFIRANPDPSDATRSEADGILIREAAALLALPSEVFLPYSRWKEQTQLLSATVSDEQFSSQVIQTFAGDESSIRGTMQAAIESHRGRLATLLARYGTIEQFVGAFIRNGVLGSTLAPELRPFHLNLPTRPDGYGGSVFSVASVGLRDGGMDDVDCKRWSDVTSKLDAPPPPTVKHLYSELQDYELPATASHPVKPVTLGVFQKHCYGAAAITIGGAGLGSAHAILGGSFPPLACIVGGPVTALVLVAVAPLANKMVAYLDRVLGPKKREQVSGGQRKPGRAKRRAK
jgi:hypothetical protein